jgi:hypothetical protein
VTEVSHVLLVGLASGAFTLLVYRGKPFEWLRDRLTGLAAELVACPFCLAGWVSLALTLWERPGIVPWGAAWAIGTAVALGLEWGLERASGPDLHFTPAE